MIERFPGTGLVFAVTLLLLISIIHSSGKLQASGAIFVRPGLTSAMKTSVPAAARVMDAYRKLPLHFEALPSSRRLPTGFISRGAGNALLLTPHQAVWHFQRNDFRSSSSSSLPLRMNFIGANHSIRLEGLDPLPGKTNHFIGNDYSKWRTDVVNFARVRYREVWPGIDLDYYGDQQEHEFDFIIAPHANPALIRLSFDGVHKTKIVRNGDLLLTTKSGEIRLRKPALYQVAGGTKRAIRGHFVIKGGKRRPEIGFIVGRYDHNLPLVIDPVITFASFLGSFYLDMATAVRVDAQGYMYVAGTTSSYYFPTTPGAFQTAETFPKIGCAGPEPPFYSPCSSAFITKITPSGNALVYSTYLGGDSFNQAEALALDGQGQVYVAGSTDASNFPVTAGALQTSRGGPRDAYLTKLNAGGNGLVFSTYLGGSKWDWAHDVEINSLGQAYVAGSTESPDFPVTPNAAQTIFKGNGGDGTTQGDAFVTKISSDGRALVYSTLIGGGGREAAYDLYVDGAGTVLACGMTGSRDFPITGNAFQSKVENLKPYDTDAFLVRLNSDGSAFLYASYLGGLGSDEAKALDVGKNGDIYLAGLTDSEDFPVTAGAPQITLGFDPADHNSYRKDCFVTRLSQAGDQLVYSSYLGGREEERLGSILVDQEGYAYVVGNTDSGDFPTTLGDEAAGTDAFLTKIHPSGAYFVYSINIGGTRGDGYTDIAFDIQRDSAGVIYMAGATSSPTFPVVNPGQSYVANGDAFILKADDPIPAGPDLTLRMYKSGPLSVGQAGAFNIQVLNLGGTKSGGTITIRDTLPAGLSYASFNGAGWSCAADGQMVTCTNQTALDPQSSSLLRLNFVVASQAVPAILNTASLSNETDGAPDNNTARIQAYVTPVCYYTLFPAAKTFAPSYGGEYFGVRAPSGCRWRIKPEAPWIKITSPVRDLGTGEGVVYFDVEEYAGNTDRIGVIGVGDQKFTLTQLKQTVSVNAASFMGGRLGQDSIAAMFGAGLATTVVSATKTPLPTNLGGTTVSFSTGNSERLAELFFVSPQQINFLVPRDIHPNDIKVVVTSGDGSQSGGTLNLGLPAPGLFSANADGQGVAAAAALRIRPGNIQSYEPVARYDSNLKKYVSQPIDLGAEDDQVYLILFGTGIFNPFIQQQLPTKVRIGGADAPVSYVGRQGQFVGLDQVNVLIPRILKGRGEVDVELWVELASNPLSAKDANKVRVNIQ